MVFIVLRDFRRWLVLLAGSIGQLLNLSELARDPGVSINTVKRWISVMEASFIVCLLKPFNANIGKRLVKSPRVYFMDTGLLLYRGKSIDDDERLGVMNYPEFLLRETAHGQRTGTRPANRER